MSPRAKPRPVETPPEPVTFDDAGDAEMPLVEVEKLLAMRDAEDAALAQATAPAEAVRFCCHLEGGNCTAPAEWEIYHEGDPHGHTDACTTHVGALLSDAPSHTIYRIGTVIQAASVVSSGPHSLDLAPVNSKIVVTDRGAVLGGPDGAQLLPKTDPANKLPVGARIQKLADDSYRSEQLSPAEDHPAKHYPSAGAAIADFLTQFHPTGLHG